MTGEDSQTGLAESTVSKRGLLPTKMQLTAIVFFAANALVNVMTFAFHLIFSRSLGPAGYSALGALLAVILVASVPLGAIQLALAKAEAANPGAAGLRRLSNQVALASVAVFAVTMLLSPLLESYLHLRGRESVALVALWIVLATASTVPQGVLIGGSRFREVSLALIAGGGIARLGLGLGLNAAGAGLNGALAAIAGGQLVSLLVMLYPLRHRLRRASGTIVIALSDSVNALAALTGLAVFGSIDDVLARHLLTGPSPGYYVAAATAGRIVLFAPGAMALLVFPRLAAAGTDEAAARALMLRTLGIVFLAGALIAGVFLAFPTRLIDLIFGNSYQAARPLIAPLVFAGCLLGVVNLAAYFLIARGSKAASLSWAASAAIVTYAYTSDIHARGLAYFVLGVAGCAAACSLLAVLRPSPTAKRLAPVG